MELLGEVERLWKKDNSRFYAWLGIVNFSKTWDIIDLDEKEEDDFKAGLTRWLEIFFPILSVIL